MPGVAVLAAAAQAREGVDAARLEPRPGEMKNYYAAKWGGFNDVNGDGTPTNSTTEWDVLKADGTPGSDGVPDNYFLVSNPLGLEKALNAALRSVSSTRVGSASVMPLRKM